MARTSTLRIALRRIALPLAALALIAAIAPVAGAADCSMAPGANCRNQDMRHLGKAMMGADMSGSDMRGADMRGMNLTNINLEGAWCPQINGDQSNAVWGRYNYTTPYYIGPTGRGIWKYGVVTSTAFGNIQFASQPVQVSATDARLAIINTATDGKRPYITLSALESKYPCYAQQAPDWLGGGY